MLYLKRWVSGNKARFRDDRLNIELDQVIVMGFPAVGVESIYRNRRADVQQFLSARHGSDFWVFNFCPVRENGYHESVFENRVSRYPFPDHHVPPFLYLSLVTREIHTWLSGSDARVAVLHCKAGKGRSGTLACAYLLSLHASSMHTLHDNFGEWSLIGAKEGLQTPSTDTSSALPAPSGSVLSGANLARVLSEPVLNTLEKVLDLHTAKRMKPFLHHSTYRKPKMGVSIPSQQRWLSYWSQILAGKGAPSLRLSRAADHSENQDIDKKPLPTKVKLIRLTIRIHDLSGIQPRLVQAASAVITGAGKGRAVSESTTGRLWASLARYSDRLVHELDCWERLSSSSATGPFRNDRWDKGKMICSFAKMGTSDLQPAQGAGNRRPISAYVLHPLDKVEADWIKVGEPDCETAQQDAPMSEGSSHPFVSLPGVEHDPEDQPGITLEADRELQIKLFMGEVTLGWVWLIPAFHMSPDSPSSSLVLSNDDIDFAIGIGKALVDMKISFVWQTCNEGS